MDKEKKKGGGEQMLFIVKITENGKDLYFKCQHFGVLNEDGTTKTPPQGIFTDNIGNAFRFSNKQRAEMVSAGYDGSKVVAI